MRTEVTSGVKPAHRLIEQNDLVRVGPNRYEIVRRVIPISNGTVRVSTPARVLYFTEGEEVAWMDRRFAAELRAEARDW